MLRGARGTPEVRVSPSQGGAEGAPIFGDKGPLLPMSLRPPSPHGTGLIASHFKVQLLEMDAGANVLSFPNILEI